MTYRLRNIAIAVALAVLAAMMTSFYVKQQKEDIQQGQDLTTVWVAKSDIPAGTAGDDVSGQLESTQVAKSAVTPGAIVQPEDLAGKVSSETVYAGEQVSLLRFSTEQEQGIRAKISGNLRAIQLPGDANQLLAGTLDTGDHVDVLGAWGVKGADDQTVARIILRDILVLQAPEVASEGSRLTEQKGDQAIMLAVTDAQAQKLFWIFTTGDWSLSLRPTTDAADSPEGFEWSGTVLTDGLTRAQVRKLLVDPFKTERTPTP
ncbi:MAG TPA: Flp pilus assembly protein CpaB [Gaiellaceae bacterium]|nr:Flp pilus assembly protein CpaB [Gaiellaceae bacterium]